MTTVTGILRDAQQNPIPNAGVTVRYTRALVGFDGGAVAQNDRLFTTDGSGELVMTDLIPGHYEIAVFMPINDNTTQAVIRRGTGTVPTGEATLTWEAFLSEPIGQFDSTVLQQAIEAAQDASGFADKAEEWAQNPEDTPVETGPDQFSALHWAAKAEAVAAQVTFPIDVADGGTGATSAGDARTNLGLGTISTQDADAVAITGGTITGLADGVDPDDAATVGQIPALAPPPPQLTTGQVTDPDDETFGTVSGERLAQHTDDAFNVSGAAPKFACRAWVNFDGATTTPTIRASGNVSSVTRNATGNFTINFSTAMPDADYSVSTASGQSANNFVSQTLLQLSAASCQVRHSDWNRGSNTNGGITDPAQYSVAIFR